MVSDNLRCKAVESKGTFPKTSGISEVCQAPAPGKGWLFSNTASKWYLQTS
jgi:hypothetical protein